jgi:alpha-1,6-mannosyltransferase
MEQVGSGHVDILVATSLIVLVASLTSKRYVLAFLAIWAGFSENSTYYLDTVGIDFLDTTTLLEAIGRGSHYFSSFVDCLWATVLPGFEAWVSLLNPGVIGKYHSSIHALVQSGLELLRSSFPNSIKLYHERQILYKLTQYTSIGFAAFTVG